MNWLKYTVKTLTVLLSTTFIASCVESMDTGTEQKETKESITVLSEVSQTKAGYEGTSVLPMEFVMDIDQKMENYNFSLVTMYKEEDNLYREQEDITLYWAGNDHSNVEIKALTIPYGIDKTAFDKAMTINVCQDQSSEENVRNSDLLGARSGDGITIEGNDIKISFNHLMSKLYVSYSISNEAYDSKATINSISIENTCISGGYSYINMDYDSSISKAFGDIQLYHDSKEHTAEAIFFPHVQTESATLVINVIINGINKVLKCPVTLKNPQGFLGGKRYKMTVKINGNGIENSSVTEVKDWVEDNTSIKDITDKTILWLGTSIPKGEGDNNYPRMVAEALGCEIINNSQEGSRASFNPAISWNSENFASTYTMGYSLSASVDDIDNCYRPILSKFLSPGTLEEKLDDCKDNSYERVLLPYIDGTLNSCEIVIIDHGYNDHYSIIDEGKKYPNVDGSLPSGLDWLDSIISGETNYVYDMDEIDKYSYIEAMSFIIEKCREINPEIKIIIGNYFATRSPTIHYHHQEEGAEKSTDLILAANEAVAAMWDLDIVNVYKYTGLDNEWYVGFEDFCKDNIHPSAKGNVESNKVIADAYVKELKRIFGGN